MALKLTSKQQSQMAYLETLPPRFQRVAGIIEQMASQNADDTTVRGMCRTLDEVKAKSQALGLSGLADAAGIMSTMARRNGSVQMKVRGLRELLGTLRANFDGAMKKASTPVSGDASEEA